MWACACDRIGASHGGQAVNSEVPGYGSAVEVRCRAVLCASPSAVAVADNHMVCGCCVQPEDAGSGRAGTMDGGGTVRLIVASRLEVLAGGTVSANGAASDPSMGGGSGGSVWVTTAKLSGSGTITADGASVTGKYVHAWWAVQCGEVATACTYAGRVAPSLWL